MRYAQTMAFTTLMLFQLFNVFNARSDERSAFVGLFSATAGCGRAIVLSLVLQWRVVYVPFLQQAFSTVSLSARRLAAVHGGGQFGAVAMRAEQTGKAHSALNRRRPLRHPQPSIPFCRIAFHSRCTCSRS